MRTSRSRSSTRLGPVGGLVVAGMVVGALVGVGALPSGAQGDRVGPPGLEAQVVPVESDPVELQVAGFHLEAGVDGADPTVVVSFRSPFAPPRQPWTVAVSVGEPGGQRVRTSLVSVAGAEPVGRTERGDGVQWRDAGIAEVSAQTEAGLARLAVPTAEAGPEAVVWVDAEITRDGEIAVSGSPVVALVDLQGERPGPSLGTAGVAEVVGGGDPAAFGVGTPGPVVRVVGRALEVVTTEPAPAAVDGVEVVDVIDAAVLTTVAAGEEARDRIEIDRRTGEVRLVAAGAEPFVAVPGTTPWLVLAPPPGDAPATVTVDLEALDEAIGGITPDRSTTQVAAERVLALADGRILVSSGVAGTLAWFDAGPAASPDAPAPPPADDGSTAPTVLVVAGLAVAALAVSASIVAVVVSRRRRAEGVDDEDEPRPITRVEALLIDPSVPVEPARPEPVLVLEPEPGADAVLVLDPERADEPGAGPAPALVSAARVTDAGPSSTWPPTTWATLPSSVGAPTAAVPDAVGTDPTVDVDPVVAEAPIPAEPVADPAVDPLASLLAEVDELSARVDRLAERRGSGPDDPR